MPAIITEGYGSQNLIITAGYGLWRRIIEEIERVIRSAIRFIPIGRKRFRAKISVYGDLSTPYHITRPVTGDFLLGTKISIFARGYPFMRVRGKLSVTGDLSVPSRLLLPLSGDLITKFRLTREVLGNLVISTKEKITVKGKKDFKKIIWTILEEEE